MNFCAHTAEDESGKRLPECEWQLLKDHLLKVESLANQFAIPLGIANEAAVAGRLHDLGKYRVEFQEYLRQQRKAGTETHHAIYGAAYAFQQEWLPQAFAVAGHHAGIPDQPDLHRTIDGEKYAARKRADALASFAQSEVGQFSYSPSPKIQTAIATEDTFGLEFATRLVFSTLVDADRLDTGLWPNEPPPDDELDSTRAGELVKRVLGERDRKRKSKTKTERDAALNRLRNDVFDACLKAAALQPGFFSLSVPTGGGKTLSAMAFALAHAKAHGLRRVIVVIPFLSIIEQNAKVYREVLGGEVVLEHHSAAPEIADVDEEENATLETATENWDAPIIVTTSVQFLESLFANSPAKCRKLHRIARSVVVFDEVQTLPTELLAPVLNVFRELQKNYGVSFVFSSATQPAFRRSPQLLDGFAPEEMREIAPEPPKLLKALRRVDYNFPKDNQRIDWPALAQRLAIERRCLCVVNLRRHAATLWEELRRSAPDAEKETVFHLSSSMCAQHRLDVLDRVRRLLVAGCPCRLVSTQLIEAGVDVDFPAVWRAMGPLDSIVQVAGRCNREGRLPDGRLGQVHLFVPEDDGLPRDKLYKTATGFATTLLANMSSEELATNPEVFTRYFGMIHSLPQVKGDQIQDWRKNLLFRTVAREAKVIEDDTQPVIVDYSEGHWLIYEIQHRQRPADQPLFDKADLRRLQRFMVNMRTRDYQILLGQGYLCPLLPNLDLHVLKGGHYHSELGLLLNQRPLEDFLQ